MSSIESFPAADPEHGVALEICKVPAGLRFTAHGSSVVSAWVDPKHAPTIALSVLKAAGQESVIVPKSTKPVEVRHFDQLRCGDAATHADEDPAKLRGFASDFLAMAEWIESKAAREAAEKAEAEAAEKKLQERREVLAKKAGHSIYMYAPQNIKTLIAQVVELEDKLDGASRD